MIGTIELYRAVRERLEEFFPNVTVQQKDIKNIQRPSFYIQYVGKSFNKIASEYYEDRISFNIVYFAEKSELLELLEIEETILTAFKTPLIIPDDTNIIFVEKDALNDNLNEEDYYISFVVDFVLTQKAVIEENGENINDIVVEISKQ